jgi:hypothetical protein
MKRWLIWLDFNQGTEFTSSLVDSMFDVLNKVGRWFRNLESKDGQEPKPDANPHSKVKLGNEETGK